MRIYFRATITYKYHAQNYDLTNISTLNMHSFLNAVTPVSIQVEIQYVQFSQFTAVQKWASLLEHTVEENAFNAGVHI